MNTDLTLLVCLTAPAVTLIIVFVLVETNDKLMEIILPTIAFIVTVWEWRKKKAREAMERLNND